MGNRTINHSDIPGYGEQYGTAYGAKMTVPLWVYAALHIDSTMIHSAGRNVVESIDSELIEMILQLLIDNATHIQEALFLATNI
ncbi:hypothetical protein [Haloarcula sp. Atlit-7R]|uniref:hypothetical protein n=1 Tax=Haloarcula sp. Atlit-7R TaxID=2282125 RepID=UPI000EF1683B|nr:hypothetical protein [Haloarcula sp. Atlit-7R]RLM88440.1 hypothetical protein D3D01_21475 [Haloarcula sp. Atlit-7R]